MRLIDPTRTNVRSVDSEYGRGMIRYREHHNGSVDAIVFMRALRIRMTQGAPLVGEFVVALEEQQAAVREHELARQADSPDWLRYAAGRLKAANEKVQELQ